MTTTTIIELILFIIVFCSIGHSLTIVMISIIENDPISGLNPYSMFFDIVAEDGLKDGMLFVGFYLISPTVFLISIIKFFEKTYTFRREFKKWVEANQFYLFEIGETKTVLTFAPTYYGDNKVIQSFNKELIKYRILRNPSTVIKTKLGTKVTLTSKFKNTCLTIKAINV